MAAVLWVCLLSYSYGVVPQQKALKSPRAAAETIQQYLTPTTKLYSGGDTYKHALRWYLDHTLVTDPGNIFDRVHNDPNSSVLIVSKKQLPKSIYKARTKHLEWPVDYYTITFFPGQTANDS